MTKKILTVILTLCLALSCGCGLGEPAPTAEPAPESPAPVIPQEDLGYGVGQTIPNFSFTAYDGTVYDLYETLGEKELVLINIWATWCGPCGMEFPYMEEAYQLYKDKVEIFALSCEPSDSDEVLAEYASEMGLSFPMAQDTPGLASAFMAFSIPTTVVVDSSGTIRTVNVGAALSTETFTSLFESYMESSADYLVRFTDAGGKGVPGVMLQVCDDSSCRVYTSDENGECRFTLSPFAYELHVLSVPEGFEADESVYTAPANGGETEIILKK